MQKLRCRICVLAMAALGACGGESSGPGDLRPSAPVPSDLQILFSGADFGGKTITTPATSATQISARVLDAAGVEMTPPTPVVFVSRDTSKLVVDATGLVTARAAGSGLIVARVPVGSSELRDSVALTFTCTSSFGFGLAISLTDSVTGTIPSVASSWRVRDVAGTFVDSGRTMGYFFSAGERAGTYRIDISTPGYRDWTADNVVVTRDQCHVIGVALTARLQRAP